MLVLTRGTAQSLRIGDRVIITVLEVKGDRVRFGLTLPRDVRVRRVRKVQQKAGTERAFDGSPGI